jgi:hypothetical protein
MGDTGKCGAMHACLLAFRAARGPHHFWVGKKYDLIMISAFPTVSRLCIYLFMNSNYRKLEYMIRLSSRIFLGILGKRFPQQAIILKTETTCP